MGVGWGSEIGREARCGCTCCAELLGGVLSACSWACLLAMALGAFCLTWDACEVITYNFNTFFTIRRFVAWTSLWVHSHIRSCLFILPVHLISTHKLTQSPRLEALIWSYPDFTLRLVSPIRVRLAPCTLTKHMIGPEIKWILARFQMWMQLFCLQCSFFTNSCVWKLFNCNWSFLGLQVVLFAYSWSSCAYSGKIRLISTLKRTVSKEAQL